jgi:hypothetical protein
MFYLAAGKTWFHYGALMLGWQDIAPGVYSENPVLVYTYVYESLGYTARVDCSHVPIMSFTVVLAVYTSQQHE